MSRKRVKKATKQDKVSFLLSRLNNYYSPDKTEDDYRKILQGMTNNRELVDLTLKTWMIVLFKKE
jgi:hypothetical protein